ncbi:MAG TPA: very short patch repair endonuclease [Methylomirabilota bacterium]|nr:very short patch repair endonuclease [Methylomirabilota bacterium]
MDVFSKRKRSEIMSRVRSRGNAATEGRLVRLFRRNGITGWRRRYQLFGTPDFVFPKMRLALFVDGCFWHCCPKHSTRPAENAAFWVAKLARNRARDRLVNRTLRQSGWRVLRIWQHSLVRRDEDKLIRRIQRVIGHTSSRVPESGPDRA